MINKDLKNKLFNYITKSMGLRPYTRGWYKGDCPSCGRASKFGVNLSIDRTNCFVCGFHPTPLGLVMELEGLKTYYDTLSFLGAYNGRDYIEPMIKRVAQSEVKLPEGYTNVMFGKSLLARQARKYIRSRGFKTEDVSYKGWGYCTSGVYLGYIVMPFYVAGKLVYFNARRYLGSGPKYNNPSIDDFGIGKSLIVYNIDALAMYDEIYLVEGVINADTIGDDAIASGGKKVSNYQISAIIKSPVEKVNLLLDPDALGDSVKIAMEICYHKKVRLVTWEGEDDVNDIGKEETLRRVNQVTWQSYNDLLKIKFDHKL